MSAFVGKGKKTVWQAWNVFEDTTEVCLCFSSLCGYLPKNEIGVFEEFVAIMYGRSISTNKVNEAHLDLLLISNVHIMEFLPQKPLILSISSTTYIGAFAMQVGNFTIAIQLGLGQS